LKLGFLVKVTGESSSEVMSGDQSTLKSKMKYVAEIKQCEMLTFFNKHKRIMMEPTCIICTYAQVYNVPERINRTDMILEIKPSKIVMGFEEIELIMTFYSNWFNSMTINVTKEVLRIKTTYERARRKVKKAVESLRVVRAFKGAKKLKKIDLRKAAENKKEEDNVVINNSIWRMVFLTGKLELVMLHLQEGNFTEREVRPPWMQTLLANTNWSLEFNKKGDINEMKGEGVIDYCKGQLFKRTDGEDKEVKESFIPMLKFGFEKFYTLLSTDKNGDMVIDLYLHKLILKDVGLPSPKALKEGKMVPAIAPDFQDIITNPRLESTEEESKHQMVFKMIMDHRGGGIIMRLYYNDFRMIVAPPVVLQLIEVSYFLTAQSFKLINSLKFTTIEPEEKPAKDLEEVKNELLITWKMVFWAKMSNVEIWIPRDIEENKSRICQFSFSGKFEYSSISQSIGMEMLSRTTGCSVEFYDLTFVMINKHLLKIGEPIEKATKEVLMPPGRMDFDYKVLEDIETNTMTTEISGYIESMRLALGFRELKFFMPMWTYYNENLFKEIPKLNARSKSFSEDTTKRVSTKFKPKILGTKVEKPESMMKNYEEPLSKVEDEKHHSLNLLDNKSEEKKEENSLVEEKKEEKAKPAYVYSIYITNMNVNIEPMIFMLSDDTGKIEQGVFKVMVTSMSLKYSSSVLDDEKKRELLNDFRDYMSVSCKFTAEILLYNKVIAEYEPIMEKWGLEADYLQHSVDSGQQICIRASNMLNFNLSYAVGNAIGITMKRLYEDESDWFKEEMEAIFPTAKTVEMMSLEHGNTEGFIFENKLGLPIVFHIQSMVGEKEPREEYDEFTVDKDGLLFLGREDLKKLRKKQAEQLLGESLKLVSEDVLRIMVKVSDWKYVPDIPIELSGFHSFLFKREIKKRGDKVAEKFFPIICHVKNSVLLI